MSLEQDIAEVNAKLGITAPDYGMFTDEGNAAVQALVIAAKEIKAPWAMVNQWLRVLASYKQYAEATDTMVREIVYDAIGADKRDEAFYV